LAFAITQGASDGLRARVVEDGVPMTSVSVANDGTAAVTNAVVANAVVLLPGDCVTPIEPVGRDGEPEKVGEARFAFRLSAVVTKAVVASAVVELPAVCVTPIEPVGRDGDPLKVGLARFALALRSTERTPVATARGAVTLVMKSAAGVVQPVS